MEFTPSGALVRSVVVPPGGPQQEAHDLIADPTGDVLVFNGTANPYLSTYDADTGSWSQRTLSGWSTSGLSSGGIALAGNRVFATDMMTSGSGTPRGIVWFDRVTGASGRFATNFNPIDLTVGKDGKLYALDSFGAIQVFNTQSLALQRTLTLPGNIGGATQWYAGIAVNTNGDIFAATSSNKIVHRFNTNGVLQNSVSVPGPGGFFGWLTDIDLSDDGQLAVGTTSGHIVRMTAGLTNVTYQTVSNTTTFVAFAPPSGPPSLSVSDATVNEGAGGVTTATFAVTLLAGGDFIAGSGTLTFAPGETSKTLSVAVLGDTASEATETFRVELANPTNAVLQDAVGIGTIVNDDTAPTISILDSTATEGDSGSVNATFTVLLSSASTNTITVDWRTWAVYTAAVSSDFADSQGTVTFAPGETSQTVTVPILADAVDESDETFMVVMSNAVGATFADSQALGTILDNDPAAPGTSLGAVSSGYAADDDGNGTFDQFLTTDSNGQLPVYNSDTFAPERRAILEFSVSSVNAAAVGSVTFDFRQTSYTFGPGYETGSVEIYGYAGNGSASLADATSAGAVFLGVYDPKDDTGPHSVALDRTAMLSLVGSGSYVGLRLVGISNAESTFYAPTGYSPPALVFHAHAVPPAVTVSIGDGSAVEGDPDGGSPYTDLVFTLTLSGASTVPVAVTWQTADGAALAGSDYVASRGVVVFNPGETVKTITIRVYKDTVHEADETFGVQLQNPSNAAIAYGNALASIMNDDPLF
jgi:hypothetical protein